MHEKNSRKIQQNATNDYKPTKYKRKKIIRKIEGKGREQKKRGIRLRRNASILRNNLIKEQKLQQPSYTLL